jgi:hypothetical protein
MASLDNFHVTNDGQRAQLRNLSTPSVYGSAAAHTTQQLDLSGVPGRWDRYNRAPLAVPLKRVDPFSRLHLGKDVPGQEWKSLQNPYLAPIHTQPTILPGGSAESWVMYQDTRPLWSRLLPLK